MTQVPWWRHAVCYQIYVRSFADSDGDGVGDLPGISARMPYLAELGVDAIWLTPFYPSPQADHGYDVADYRNVNPLFGTLGDFDALLEQAHGLGIKVIVDVVPNHSSSEHAWFQAALAAGHGSAERACYIFRDGLGTSGETPPNNWQSMFGGPAWTRVPDGQWYLHLFDTGQPDFDWSNPEVGDEFERILRFWLDRGVDGFRIDVAHAMVKAPGLPDVAALQPDDRHDEALHRTDRPYWDQPAVHDIYRRWHAILAEYPGDRMAIGEAWVETPEAMARYVRPDELQQCFNFHWLEAEWSAHEFREVLAATIAAVEPVGASPTWVLSNHDVRRTVTRYGDGAVGLARARAALLAMLALPGSAYLYQGEELGLPEVDVPLAARQDPQWLRGGGPNRDGARVPLPWSGEQPPFGFAPDCAATWLPQPPQWSALTVERQERDSSSTLLLVRAALRLRHDLLSSLGDGIEVLDRDPDVLAYARSGAGSPLMCVLNCGRVAVDVSDLGDPLLMSGPDAVRGGTLAPNTAAWLRA
ncbi:MAG: glycoside hydrolase family 13 protein [Nocardioidaceae bacterium]|nr:glycoside hydrolase family 13 protein [Nocardioidaceae bacterium]